MKLITKSEIETQNLGQKISKALFHNSGLKERALVLNLNGDLGGGKTTFVQGLARGLGIKKSVLSPTFVLSKRYELDGLPFNNFYHFDCYRLETKNDIDSFKKMHLIKILKEPKNIVAIEWSEKLKDPRLDGISLYFIFKSEKEREIKIEGLPSSLNIKEIING